MHRFPPCQILGDNIGRKEAKDIGLPIIIPEDDDKVEKMIWQLYLKYEKFLKLADPVYPEIELGIDENKILKDLPVAIIESAKKLHIHKVNVDLTKNRKIPPSLQINLNVNLQLPPSIQPNQIPQQSQQILQQLMAQIS